MLSNSTNICKIAKLLLFCIKVDKTKNMIPATVSEHHAPRSMCEEVGSWNHLRPTTYSEMASGFPTGVRRNPLLGTRKLSEDKLSFNAQSHAPPRFTSAESQQRLSGRSTALRVEQGPEPPGQRAFNSHVGKAASGRHSAAMRELPEKAPETAARRRPRPRPSRRSA